MRIVYAINFRAACFFVDSRIRCHVPGTRRVMFISYGATVHTTIRQRPPRSVESIRITGIVRVTQTRSLPYRVHASPESISVCPAVSYMGIIRGVGTIIRAIRDEYNRTRLVRLRRSFVLAFGAKRYVVFENRRSRTRHTTVLTVSTLKPVFFFYLNFSSSVFYCTPATL